MKKQTNLSNRLSLFPHAAFCFLLPALFALGATSSFGGQDISTVATMDVLSLTEGVPGQVVQLLGYHQPGDPGGGLFVWDDESEAEPNGGTVVAVEGNERGRWHRMADDVKATYFGARGDGETDDTAAIQAALDSVSSTASPGVISEADRHVGGTVHLPKGKYRITDTLLLGPHTALEGMGSVQGFQRRSILENDHGTVLIGDFEDPRKWMISTAVYRRTEDRYGELVGYRGNFGGGAYDAGNVSRANGVRVRDLLLIGRENENGDVPYGGVRFQAAPGAVLDGVGVFNVDVAWLLGCGWGMTMRDCQSQSHLYGLLILYSVNGLHVDSCYINGYSGTERQIDDSNFAPPTHLDQSNWGKWHLPEDYFHMTRGIYSHYGHNVTLNNVITEHWDIGRVHVHGTVSDTGSWLEGISEIGYVLVSANLDLRNPNIYAPGMIREGRFMLAGTNVNATINTGHQGSSFPITYASRWQNNEKRISVQEADPDRVGWHYYPFVSYPNQRQGYIRVAGDDDEEVDNRSLADSVSYVDLATALERIAASDRRDWEITVKDGAVCTLSKPVELADKELTLKSESDDGERPSLVFHADTAGRAGLLRFRDGGELQSKGIDWAVTNPDGVLDPSYRGLITVRGGRFDLQLTDADISLADRDKAPEQKFSLIMNRELPSVVEATMAKVEIDSGQALFETAAGVPGSFSFHDADTIMPESMEKQNTEN